VSVKKKAKQEQQNTILSLRFLDVLKQEVIYTWKQSNFPLSVWDTFQILQWTPEYGMIALLLLQVVQECSSPPLYNSAFQQQLPNQP
jgi:hypothetical protein